MIRNPALFLTPMLALAMCTPLNAQTSSESTVPSVPGQVTSGTAQSAVPSFRQAAVHQNVPAAAKKTVVFFGERPKWSQRDQQPPINDIVATSSQLLNATVEDQTQRNEKIADSAKRVQAVTARKPDAVVVFTGGADEKAHTSDGDLETALKTVVDAIRQNNIPVFLVPSASSVSASVTGRMRVVAGTANAVYIEPGTDYEGRPYEEAMQEISKQLPGILDAAKGISTPANLAAPATGSGRVSAGPAETPIVIQMQPPAPLKSIDPREMQKKQKRRETKKPALSQ